MNELDGARVTDIRFCDDGKTETFRDQWMSSGSRSRAFKKRWTGCSIFQLKVPGKHPPEVQVIGNSEHDDKFSACSQDEHVKFIDGRLVMDTNAFVEAPIEPSSSEDGIRSHVDQSEVSDESEVLLRMNEVDLGFSTEMPDYDEQSGSEAAEEDQDPGAMTCACSSCQVEDATERCENESKDVCPRCVLTCPCGLKFCVRCFYKHRQQCPEETQILKIPSNIFELHAESELQVEELLQHRQR